MTHRLLIAVAALGLLAACAGPTPYSPADPNTGYGFENQRLEENRWKVTFSGNSITDLETVNTYVLYRAAELTLEEGYDWFEVVTRDVDADRQVRATGFGPGFYSGFSYRYFHPVFGYRRFYDYPFATDFDLREITRYEAIAEIVLNRGDKPTENTRAYDAADVQRNLAGDIILPTVR